MKTNIEPQNYYEATNILTLGKWEFFLYLLIAFVVGYLVHYIFSNRRDYVRTPKKRNAFYYNHNLSAGYYPNSEPIRVAPKQIQTQVVPTAPVYVQTPKQAVHHIVKEPVITTAVKSTKDDLKKVEGIGPKIEELLNTAGIHTWHTLSKTSVQKLKSILNNAGKRFQMHDPSTWGEQSHLAETGQWNALQEYQDFLNGGKHV